MVILVGLGIGLLFEVVWAGLALLAVAAWGAWRAWNVLLVIEEDAVVIHNPIRRLRAVIGPDATFEVGQFTAIYPFADVVQVTWPARRVPIVATGSLQAGDRRRLVQELERLRSRTGCRTTVPASWPSQW
jgi:hypothetical protein